MDPTDSVKSASPSASPRRPASDEARVSAQAQALDACALPTIRDARSAVDVLQAWSSWASDGCQGESGERDLALRAVRDCIERHGDELILSDLGLDTVPDLFPPRLERLDVSHNRLAVLPSALPAGLRDLDVSENALTELPAHLPAGLRTIDASANVLTVLPDTLPESLLDLHVSGNLLTQLPERLPSSLETLSVERNLLIALPASLPDRLICLRASQNQLSDLPARLPPGLTLLDLVDNLLRAIPEAAYDLPSYALVRIEGNDLSDGSLALLTASQAGRRSSTDGTTDSDSDGESGPIFHFSMAPQHTELPVMPLGAIVSLWLPEAATVSVLRNWSAFAREDNAAAFGPFLLRLTETVSAISVPDFKARVADWLKKLAKSATLRAQTFEIAQGATASCEDRVALTYNLMQVAALRYDVESGRYDRCLPELLNVAREMFCLEALERIARDKVKTLRAVDELEVFLAFQTRLRDSLKLSAIADEMRFFDVSQVTDTDLDRARESVRNEERHHFFAWLAQWPPFQAALLRLGLKRAAGLSSDDRETFYTEHADRVRIRLATDGLSGIPDAEAVIGQQIWDDMISKQDNALATAFFLDRYGASLDPPSGRMPLLRVEELALIASNTPCIASRVVQLRDVEGRHFGSRIAEAIELGSTSALADAYLSLLRILRTDGHLSDRALIEILLPRRSEDPVKSLSHAVIASAWRSAATSTLCSLLADVTRAGNVPRAGIVARLSQPQVGYVFQGRRLRRPTDFFKLAKHADRVHANPGVVALLKTCALIPRGRELYDRATDDRAPTVVREPDYVLLLGTIASATRAQVLRSRLHARPDQDNAGKPSRTAQRTRSGRVGATRLVASQTPGRSAGAPRASAPAVFASGATTLATQNEAGWPLTALWYRRGRSQSWRIPGIADLVSSTALRGPHDAPDPVRGIRFRPLDLDGTPGEDDPVT